MSKKYIYQRKTDRLNRSVDVNDDMPQGNPYKLLASAILLQAAIDCASWTPELEDSSLDAGHLSGIKYLRFGMLRQFINSDWIDILLCWQHQITPEGYCEELVRRLTS